MKNVLFTIGGLLYINTIAMIMMGINRITKYESGGDFSKGVHAYVGGDAYNYIINANMQTGLFVLGAASFIVASMFICTAIVLTLKK